MLTIVTTPRRVALISPYLPRMVERARQLDGSWSEDFLAWIFRPSAAQAIQKAVRRHYQQNPDSLHLADYPANYETLAQLALDTRHPEHATEADIRTRDRTLPIGMLLYTSHEAQADTERWQFQDGSALIRCDGELFLGIHPSRPEFTANPYATLYQPDHLHLVKPLEQE